MNNVLANQVQLLLSQNNISCDKEELSFQIQSHPSYPSLHSITGVLDHFNIDNLALDVPVNKETLTQFPTSFLAQLETERGREFAVIKSKGSKYEAIFSEKGKKQLSSDAFLKQFTGIIVAVEKTKNTITTNSNNKLISSILLSLCMLFSIAVLFNNGISIMSGLYILTSIVGFYISTVIIKQELGEKTILGEAFCSSSNINSKNNCSSVLSSKGAYIGNYKLSDFSLIYFSGLTLVSFLLTIMDNDIVIPLILSFVALPITFYSFYYQYAIVKQWCFLCLSIVGVLWIQAVLSLVQIDVITSYIIQINSQDILITLFVFISVFAIWNALSPTIKLIKELKESKVRYFKFKRDFNIFQSLLNKSKKVDTFIPNASEIVFGNPKAPLIITLITSPFCGHCKPVHTTMEQILKKYPEEVQIHIRFSANEADTLLVNITSRLLEIYHQDGKLKCLDAMNEIYGDMNMDSWISKWGETSNKPPYLNILKSENEWCLENAINFTPEILINGRSYPREYERSELIYFIEDLHSSFTTEDLSVVEAS